MQEAASLSRLTETQSANHPELDRIKRALAEDRQSSSSPAAALESSILDAEV